MKLFLILIMLFCSNVFSNSIFQEFKIIFKYDLKKYIAQRPAVFGPRGVMLYLEEKENLHVTYQLLAAGFAKSDEDFKIVFNKLKNQHVMVVGGKNSNESESENMSSGLYRRSFISSNKMTNDVFELIYDKRNFQYFLLQGTQIIDKTLKKSNQLNAKNKFFKQFRGLASSIHSIDLGVK